MRSKAIIEWASIRDSLWFVPATITAVLTALAIALITLERQGTIEVGDARLLLGGGIGGARAVLSSVVTGLITVTGVAFSVTVVALQLSSSQFSPRVLPNFMADRANQYVLGILIGTFTYSLIVLRVVDAPAPGAEPFLPELSVAVGMVLAVISIGSLIFFINHTARSIQIPVILMKAARQGLAQIDRLFPQEFGKPDGLSPHEEEIPADHYCVRASKSGYLQAVDAEAMFKVGKSANAVVRMEHRIGDFILEHEPLARVWPKDELNDDLERQLLEAFIIGFERTQEQDFELILIEISDIAVKALSPSINDPTTAQQCIDRLSDLLLALARRHSPAHIRTEEGRLHVIVRDLPFEIAVGRSFAPILHFGSANPAIRDRILARVDTMLDLVPAERRPPLVALREAVLQSAAEAREE